METIKDMLIGTVFILVCSVSILFFAIGYPALNGQSSVLNQNPEFNQTAFNLTRSLGQYQTNQSTDVNITTADEPQASASGLFLVSTTATNRHLMSRLTDSFGILTTLLGNVFGLSGGQFTIISGILISLFAGVLLYLIVKVIRYGV